MSSGSGTDNETLLIENIKKGERTGFDRIVDMYQQKGISIAYNLVGNFEDARDVLQEAFIKVYLHIKNFQEKAQFSTWFYRIVTNCALDLLRKRKKMHKVFTASLIDEDGKEKDAPDKRYEPTKIILNHELNQNLDKSIANLPKNQKICFILKYQNGLNIQDISEVIKCNPSTVKVHLFRAIRTLQDKLAGYLIR